MTRNLAVTIIIATSHYSRSITHRGWLVALSPEDLVSQR
jgi:hypothetical protein